MCNVLEGLHGAHETKDDAGEPLALVHRDVSPHNVLVGVDGVARVFDFGIAKAATNTEETRDGVVKGKVTYMAPEQVWNKVDRRADVYAAGVILWELVAGRRRHAGERNDALFLKLVKNELEVPTAPSSFRPEATPELDEVIARATHPDPEQRYATAREMAVALEAAVMPAPARAVSEWVRTVAGDRIERRSAVMRRIEADTQGPSSIDAISLSGFPSTGTMRVVTGTMSRPSIVPTSMHPAVMSGPPSWHAQPHPPRRNWTLPAAFFAFATGMLMVGLRVHSNQTARSPRTAEIVVGASAREPQSSSNLPKTEVSAPPASSVLLVVPSALPSAPASSESVKSTAQGSRSWHPASPPAPAPRGPSRPQESLPSSAPKGVEPSPPNTNPGHKPGCESPFAIGPDGIRQIKPECM
jgi:serine/threonine-protein kinase